MKFNLSAINSTNIKKGISYIRENGLDGIAKLGVALLGLRTGGRIFDNFFLNLKTMGPFQAIISSFATSFSNLGRIFGKNAELINKETIAKKFNNSETQKTLLFTLQETAARTGNAIAQKSNIANLIKEKLVTKGLLSVKAANIALSFGTVGAIAAIAVGLIGLYKLIKNNSPEEKFKKLQESTEQAGDAAQEVTSKYQNLKEKLDELNDKYEVLDNLTSGTQAWKEAVQETNDQVFNLIEQYKELAKYVKIEDGVLTLDFESPEVQNIITGYEDKAKEAKVINTSAEIALEQATRENLIDNLDRNYKVKSERLVGNSGVSIPIYYSNEELQEVAKQYATGKIGVDDDSDRAKTFRQLGQQILNSEALEAVQYKSLASEILKDLEGDFTSEQIQGMGNIVTPALVNNLIEQLESELDFNRTESLNKYAAALGYSEKEGFEIQGNKIKYLDENGQKQSVTVTDEQLKLSEASILATDKLTEAMIQMPAVLEDKLLGAFYSSAEGRDITKSDLAVIEAAGGVEAYATEEWKNLAPEIQKLYGDNEENFSAFLQESVDFANSYYEKAENAVEELDVDFKILDLHSFVFKAIESQDNIVFVGSLLISPENITRVPLAINLS